MLFKKLVIPMCEKHFTKNCSKLVFYKTDVKDITLQKIDDDFFLHVLLNNLQSYNIPVSTPKIVFEGIIIEHHIGSWYVIDHVFVENKLYFLLEHEEYGDEAANIIIDHTGQLILDNVYNGFDDLDDYFDNLEREAKQQEEENTIHIVVQQGLIEAVYASNRNLRVSIIDLDIQNTKLKETLFDEIQNLKKTKYDILE